MVRVTWTGSAQVDIVSKASVATSNQLVASAPNGIIVTAVNAKTTSVCPVKMVVLALTTTENIDLL